MKMLDCFCGLGGASEGFHREGFECTGIEIETKIAKLYPYKVIVADMRELDGEDFMGYDVIWGSPPCRDFTILNDKRWKRKKNVHRGLASVHTFLAFVKEAKPKIWIMENTFLLAKHLVIQPKINGALIKGGKRHVFYGNFPNFLLPQTESIPMELIGKPFGKMRKWERAMIPLACSLAFAKACKQKLVEA